MRSYLMNDDGTAVETVKASAVVLATGGASKAYRYNQSRWASGDGIAVAWRAGCRIANMEFNQFTPPALRKNLSSNGGASR